MKIQHLIFIIPLMILCACNMGAESSNQATDVTSSVTTVAPPTSTLAPSPLPTPTLQPTPMITDTETPTLEPLVSSVAVDDIGQTLILRSGPSTNYAQLALIPNQDVVTLVGKSADGGWLLVDYEGQQGWVVAGAVTTSENQLQQLNVIVWETPTPAPPTPTEATVLLNVTTTGGVTLREGPGYMPGTEDLYPEIEGGHTIAVGDHVEVFEWSNQGGQIWLHVTDNINFVAWVWWNPQFVSVEGAYSQLPEVYPNRE